MGWPGRRAQALWLVVPVLYGDKTWQELRDLASPGTVAIVPFGCTEQQSVHLPVDFDTWFAAALTAEAAERRDAAGRATLVLPTIPFGPTPEHRAFGAGFVDLPVPVHAAVARAAVLSLIGQGFRTIVLWRGCGGHDLSEVARSQYGTDDEPVQILLPEPPLPELWRQAGAPEVPGGHADSFTTSICLYRRPGAVRPQRPVPSETPDWTSPSLNFADYTSDGTIGDARFGSAETGRVLWGLCVEWLEQYLQAHDPRER